MNGVLKRKKAKIPTLVVGNLTVGGTGKTPMTVWLAGQLMARNPAILSRGYGRKTNGFLKVTQNMPVENSGDEPAEMRLILPEQCFNYVCEKRHEGIERIAKEMPLTGVVILDDGFQHLPLQPHVSLILCDFNRPFYNDFPMPAGNLREFAWTAKYATAIIVTKTPNNLSYEDALKWRTALSRYGKPVYFSSYNNIAPVNSRGDVLGAESVVLVSALADNVRFEKWGRDHYQVSGAFAYKDHHYFTRKDLDSWKEHMATTGAVGILSSAKDAVKIREIDAGLPLYVTRTVPQILFGGEDDLIELLLRKIDSNV